MHPDPKPQNAPHRTLAMRAERISPNPLIGRLDVDKWRLELYQCGGCYTETVSAPDEYPIQLPELKDVEA